MLSTSSITGHITLESAGLIALADLSTVAVRTALTGTASYLDILVLAPGMHQQQSAVKINDGELPEAGSLTTEYTFRVENPATVSYLRHIGRTGKLVTAWVSPKRSYYDPFADPFFAMNLSPENTPFFVTGVPATLLYLLCPLLTIIVFALLGAIGDWWAFGVLGMLVLARFINVVVIKRRSHKPGWKGKKEPGVPGDFLILLSQDRWVRLRGSVDDLKAVTAGQWLRGQTSIEGFATLLVYAAAALAGNASTVGSLHIACLLLCSAALLSLCNSSTQCLQMFDRIVRKYGEEKGYKRRLEMVEELVRASKKGDWAVQMRLIKPDEVAALLK
ncbi:uncharacterized protein EV420DRAFT_1160348 [Desarmillaria tabescens]|uniref:Uncharacterized protein n=1 Tax=Armillaria tabescens TaxID=1929756 RepID=A0AA39TLF0_ARMTA|nr:uncharacterized protein EV420DRAFT_1160348 [Desarmillaria tabescens]KAK0463197.1 hypothetical protein EV420DRAFT_1160348 [Desarmillaria tabescens]